jgi:molecular chaperone HscB
MESPLFCDHCHSLYPAEGLSHFDLLGFPPQFDLDPAALRQKYLQVSCGVHPDHHGDSAELATSLRLSAQLNEAHRVLADPVLRAEYLLELSGGPSASDDKSNLDGVLANTLMLREEITDAHAANDSAALADCVARIRQLRETTLARIGDLARQLPADAEIRRQLRATLNSIKYYQKLLADL